MVRVFREPSMRGHICLNMKVGQTILTFENGEYMKHEIYKSHNERLKNEL